MPPHMLEGKNILRNPEKSSLPLTNGCYMRRNQVCFNRGSFKGKPITILSKAKETPKHKKGSVITKSPTKHLKMQNTANPMRMDLTQRNPIILKYIEQENRKGMTNIGKLKMTTIQCDRTIRKTGSVKP